MSPNNKLAYFVALLKWYFSFIFNIEFIDTTGNSMNSEEADWDTDLNRGLLDLKIKSSDIENETYRFFLIIRDSFKKPEIRFGDGIFNATLGYMLKSGPFGEFESIATVLSQTRFNEPDIKSSSYHDCAAMIDSIISKHANSLNKLESPRDTAEEILVKSIALFLDIRFFVSSRKRIGFS